MIQKKFLFFIITVHISHYLKILKIKENKLKKILKSINT